MLLLSGCATTSIATFKDPDFSHRIYKKIVVGYGLKREWGQNLFHSISSKADNINANVELVDYETIFYPTRQYSENEVRDLIQKNKIDGFLFFRLQNAGTQESYVPQYHSETTVTSNRIGGYKADTYNYGGYNISKPYFLFNIELVDAETERKAWVAESKTGGNAFAGWGDLIDSLSAKVVNGLYSEGLIEKRLEK